MTHLWKSTPTLSLVVTLIILGGAALKKKTKLPSGAITVRQCADHGGVVKVSQSKACKSTDVCVLPDGQIRCVTDA
jgi:putative hemolysin